MKGYSLSLFQGPLHKVSLKESLFPISARDRLLCLPEVYSDSDVVEMFFSEEWRELLKDFPSDVLFDMISFEEIARIMYSDSYFFTDKVRRDIEDFPRFRIIQKIQSSFWRWGNNNDASTWNTMVDVYEQIRTFSIPLEGFEVSVDWTTGFNPKGFSESLRLYLDGVFGFFVHYNGQHVMTIGFSFTNAGELLLNQIQLVRHKGNRFLYSLPSHYIEWVTGLMTAHFQGRKIFIVDGKSLADSIYNSYFSQVQRHREEFKRHRRFLPVYVKDSEKKSIYRSLEYHYDQYKAYWKKVISFRKDFERIVALYDKVHCVKDNKITKNDVIFYPVS